MRKERVEGGKAYSDGQEVRFCACYSQALTKSASRKKWYVLVPLDGFPCRGAHECLRVMGLERAESRRVSLSFGLCLVDGLNRTSKKNRLNVPPDAFPGSATLVQ